MPTSWRDDTPSNLRQSTIATLTPILGSFKAMKFVKEAYKSSKSLDDFNNKIEEKCSASKATGQKNNTISKATVVTNVQQAVPSKKEASNTLLPPRPAPSSSAPSAPSVSSTTTTKKRTYIISNASSLILIYDPPSLRPPSSSSSSPPPPKRSPQPVTTFSSKSKYLRNLDDTKNLVFNKEETERMTKKFKATGELDQLDGTVITLD
ncbi:hypothetical protein TrVE_jg13328 [Triparma verrucosa]|uniref:Uncharacterized protein n=1 Tax=Triparma verrucosa TaxID=1606542 RepID=A0A9W7CKA2_9STRA|nr:hypothetical protein TrVE_jg13328 [Triparma verrucosa]